MPGTWNHLALRFVDVVTARALDNIERATVRGWLNGPVEEAAFFAQKPADQRHGFASARYMATEVPDRIDLVRAALLHDVGKRHANLGPIARALASFCIRLGLPMPPRWRLYRDHGALSAAELAGAEPIVIDFARHHHGDRPATIPPDEWETCWSRRMRPGSVVESGPVFDHHYRLSVSYHVSTAVFEGPLDLLLQLITRHQVDVTAVNLSDLVTEYIAHVEEMRRLDLDVTSEFLLIAATLIQLKAHALLPTDGVVDLDEELALMEERERLLARLLTCVTFKDVAFVLRHRLQEANRFVPRVAGLDQEIAVAAPDVVIPTDAVGLARIAATALTARQSEPDLDHLDLDLPSVQSAIEELRARMAEEVSTSFEALVAHCSRPVEVAAYFLAMLELARWGLLQVSQTDWLADIEVTHTGATGSELVSEWAI